jgi:hypothetical protein
MRRRDWPPTRQLWQATTARQPAGRGLQPSPVRVASLRQGSHATSVPVQHTNLMSSLAASPESSLSPLVSAFAQDLPAEVFLPSCSASRWEACAGATGAGSGCQLVALKCRVRYDCRSVHIVPYTSQPDRSTVGLLSRDGHGSLERRCTKAQTRRLVSNQPAFDPARPSFLCFFIARTAGHPPCTLGQPRGQTSVESP